MEKGKMYRALVENPDDILGLVAYAIYKGDKQAFIDTIASQFDREPTADEYHGFHISHAQPRNLESYRQQAKQLFDNLVSDQMEEYAQQLLEDEREGMLAQKLGVVTEALDAAKDRLSGVETLLGAVDRNAREKKGFWGWVRECATVIVATLIVIVIIGLLSRGLEGFDKMNQTVESQFISEHKDAHSKPSSSDPSAAPAPATAASSGK